MPHGKAIVTVIILIVSGVAAYLVFKPENAGTFSGASKAKRDIDLEPGVDLRSLDFPEDYHATGVLRLPTSQVDEPFEIWYSKSHDKSRIDYYEGDVKTYQRGDLSHHGMYFKIVPKYSYRNHRHYQGCWKRYGSRIRRIGPQSVLPSDAHWPFRSRLKDFKYVGDVTIDGRLCTKWTFKHKIYEKNNRYAFYATKTDPPKPVRFEMNGYDTLLVSYYDRYIVDYHSFHEWSYDREKFELPHLKNDKWCWDMKKIAKGSDGATVVVNPMSEFASIGHSSDPVEGYFTNFRTKHSKKYVDQKEHQKRKHIFRHNLRYIRSINRRSLPYKLTVNHFADLTDHEFGSFKGSLDDDDDIDNENSNELNENDPSVHSYRSQDEEGFNAEDENGEITNRDQIVRKREHKTKFNQKYIDGIPRNLDWRKYGAVAKPKGQGTCGSCWSFASAGAVEGANFLKTGRLIDLSEQQLIDCTWFTPGVRNGNNGCLGGWTWKTFAWIKKFGIATTESYGHYRGQEGYCKTEGIKTGARIDGFRRVKRYHPDLLRKAIAYHGPATISINANPKALKFYSKGVLDDPRCSNKTDHAVLLIGYGKENGVPYWLVKNSWSESWGDHGFVKIRQGQCGIEKRPFVAINNEPKRLPWKVEMEKEMKKLRARKDEIESDESFNHDHHEGYFDSLDYNHFL